MAYKSKFRGKQIDDYLDRIGGLATVATSGSYNDLANKPTIPSAVTESIVSGWGFTKNTGTVTGVKVNGTTKSQTSGTVDIGNVVTSIKINGSTKTPSSGVVDLGTISGGGSSGGSGVYVEVNHGTSDTTFTLTPNTFHVWDEVSALTLTLGSETSGIANEYLFQFTSGATATSLTLPSDLKWANDNPPTIAENMIYQVSILKGLASVLEFSNTQLILINFTIGGTQYQAEEGMSWNVWCNSQYNTDFEIDGGWIWKGIRYYIGLNGMPETPSSIIIDGTSYELIDDMD